MAWLSSPIEIEDGREQKWKLEWAVYNEKFTDVWGTISGAGDADGKRKVVRRIKVREIELVYPGLTKAAAEAKLNLLTADVMYMGGRMRKGVTDNYTVTARKREYETAGWSPWIPESSLPGYGGPTP